LEFSLKNKYLLAERREKRDLRRLERKLTDAATAIVSNANDNLKYLERIHWMALFREEWSQEWAARRAAA
jgi:hypothetical protein